MSRANERYVSSKVTSTRVTLLDVAVRTSVA